MTDTTLTLTPKEAYDLMASAVQAKGKDYIYKQVELIDDEGNEYGECRYLEADETGKMVPSCIVGHVLIGAGVDPDKLREYEGTASFEVVKTLLDIPGDDPLNEALDIAQKAQDGGYPWSTALDRFRAHLDFYEVDYR